MLKFEVNREQLASEAEGRRMRRKKNDSPQYMYILVYIFNYTLIDERKKEMDNRLAEWIVIKC